MEMTKERYQSAQEEKKQLTLKVEELERLEILGSLVLLTFLSTLYCAFFPQNRNIFSLVPMPLLASRILHICLSHRDLQSGTVH